MTAILTLSADSSEYVAAIKRATKAAKRLSNALDKVERTPVVISVVSA